MRGFRAAVLPARIEVVEVWIAEEGRRGNRRLKELLSGLKSWHTDLGLDADGLSSESLRRMIRGIMRWHGAPAVKQALPITKPILSKIVNHIRLHPSLYGGLRDSMNLVAAFLLAFAGFLRGSNFTYDHYDSTFDLARRHVHLYVDAPHVSLPASKTDVFRRGENVYLPRLPGSELCPVAALRALLETFPGEPSEALFSLKNGKAAFRRDVVIDKHLARAVKEVGVVGKHTGHSFRRGAGTTAKAAGCSGDEIQAMGRWKSDSYKRYIDMSPAQHRDCHDGRDTLAWYLK